MKRKPAGSGSALGKPLFRRSNHGLKPEKRQRRISRTEVMGWALASILPLAAENYLGFSLLGHIFMLGIIACMIDRISSSEECGNNAAVAVFIVLDCLLSVASQFALPLDWRAPKPATADLMPVPMGVLYDSNLNIAEIVFIKSVVAMAILSVCVRAAFAGISLARNLTVSVLASALFALMLAVHLHFVPYAALRRADYSDLGLVLATVSFVAMYPAYYIVLFYDLIGNRRHS